MSQELFTMEDIEAVLESVNKERLSKYLIHTSNDLRQTANLYLWNLKISSEFWFIFNIFEVTLRNSIDEQISLISLAQDWLDDEVLLHRKELGNINRAREKFENSNYSISHDRIIAELNFGFWVALFQNNYHSALWVKGLDKCFPNYDGTRKKIHEILENLRILRNRIAHHEPIFQLNLDEQFINLTNLVSLMNSNMAGLIDRNSQVPFLLSNCP